TLAHEFWIEPIRYRLDPGEGFRLYFFVGENFVGERWTNKRKRLQSIAHYMPTNLQQDLLKTATESDSAYLDLRFNEEGTHMVAMSSQNAYIELDAQKFNAYLEEDGLSDVLEHRRKTHTDTMPARELYCRYAKAIVQVSEPMSATFGQKVGTPLEILPITNPYALQLGERMSIKVLYKGEPAQNKLVKVWHRQPGGTRQQNLRTNMKGNLSFPVDGRGVWMVSLVHMVPAADSTQADWQSHWATLTFGM
ncbi:MAG TPA: DUF4198 domain-containing protein, partial [Saprospiraceae bacterium]|nr:DUF4198 domain-containing protein [Saprospiraceae bacterium]